MSAQNQYNPDTVSPPCETLQDLFEERNLTPDVFAAYSEMPIETVEQLLQGAIPITLETAATISRMFSIPAQFWLNRQENYDQWVKQQEGQN